MEDMELPSILDSKLTAFCWWNGDPPAPSFTHWTANGTIVIRAKTPCVATEVLWKPKDSEEARLLGSDDINPYRPARNLHVGNYDRNAGFAISSLVPKDLLDWNNLDD